jgi:hypothetical protein
MIRHDATPMSN